MNQGGLGGGGELGVHMLGAGHCGTDKVILQLNLEHLHGIDS